jgi:alpha-beta hydrolase superfamily lysophospholipase
MPQHTSLVAPRICRHTAGDGYRFAVRVWNAPRPKTRILLIHGITSHSGWYLRSCSHLARAGFEVHALDRRGSGLNLAERGDVPGCETWQSDVAGYLQSLPAAQATIMLGVSWGGKFALAFARNRPELVDAIGLLCPGLFAKQVPGPVTYLALRAAAAAGLASWRVPIPLRDPALFTAAPEWQSYLRTDPFALRRVTIRWVLSDRRLSRAALQSPSGIQQPVLLALAGRDRIVDNRRTLEFFHRLGSRDRTVLKYQNAEHTLEFEPDPVPFLDDLARWAKKVGRKL